MARPSIGITFASLGALGFSFKAVFIKAAYVYGVDAETLLALRMGYSLPFFIVMGLITARRSPMQVAAADWRTLGLLGVLGYYLASYLDFLGLQYITAGLERLILFLYPTFVLLLSALFLHKPIRRAAVAVVGDMRVSPTGSGAHTLLGCALVAASALAYAVYLMMSGQVVLRLGATRVTAYASLVACALSIAQFLLVRPIGALVQPWQVHALGICMAIFGTVLPIWLVAEAIRRLGASSASMVGSLGPIFTIILAALILGEHIGPAQFIGAALVILGVSRVSKAKG
jgi:drug/metabolite transporter (DMT)-like permease